VKTVIVVGANTDINIEGAKHFARTNAVKFFSACHSKRKGKSTVSGTFERYPLPSDTQSLVEIELSERWKASILPTSLPCLALHRDVMRLGVDMSVVLIVHPKQSAIDDVAFK